MTQPFLGEIRPFGFNFAPVGWARCDGAVVSIALYENLFQLIGTTYGGDGEVTFALPDLRDRSPIHMGTGPGLESYVIGQTGGLSEVILLSTQMAPHTHLAQSRDATGDRRAPFPIGAPTGNRWAQSEHTQYTSGGTDTSLHPNTVGITGGSLPHNNESPFLTVLFCIALEGIYPSPS